MNDGEEKASIVFLQNREERFGGPYLDCILYDWPDKTSLSDSECLLATLPDLGFPDSQEREVNTTPKSGSLNAHNWVRNPSEG